MIIHRRFSVLIPALCFTTSNQIPPLHSMEAGLRGTGLRNIARGIGRISDLVVDRAQGSHVFTVDGAKYLDFTAGIGVTNLGE